MVRSCCGHNKEDGMNDIITKLRKTMIVMEEDKSLLFQDLDDTNFDVACSMVEDLYNVESVGIEHVFYSGQKFIKIRGI